MIKYREDNLYDLLQVCTASHYLLYHLLVLKDDDDHIPKAMKDFFVDPKIMVIRMKMHIIMNMIDADFDVN